jgi:hypothetical protein
MITNFTLKGICFLLLLHATVVNASASYNEDSVVAQGSPNTCGQIYSFTTTASGKWVHANGNGASSQPATDSLNMIASIEDNTNYGIFYASYYTSSVTRLMPSGKPYLNRNITIVPANQITVNDPITIRLYFTKKEFDALKAADNNIKTVKDLSIMRTKDSTCMSAATSFYVVMVPSASGVINSANGSGYYVEFTTYSFGTFFIAGSKSTVNPSFFFTSWKGTYGQGQTNLDWGTAYEVITKKYLVQRSTDSVNFETIDSLVAKDGAINNYSYIDKAALKGTVYYRLKITNSIPFLQYSPVITVIGDILVDFSACYKNKVVKANWKVTNIKAISNFTVEKRLDLGNYSSIGTIVLKDSASTASYAYDDTNPMASITYYRLKIIKKDGSLEYSQDVPVGSDLKGKILIFPTPAVFNITLAYELLQNNATAQLYAADGQLLKTYELAAGSTQMTLNIGAMAQGVYIVVVNNNGKKITRRFVKD